MSVNVSTAATVQKISAQASRVTQGEALVVLIEQRKLHRLNPVGTRVWELCDGRRIAEIVDVIVAEFAVEHAVASQDVLTFIESLRGLGAVQVSEPSA
ncbi:MAG: PqqD family protein [Polyangiales bacterium]